MASALFDLTQLFTQGTLKFHQAQCFERRNGAGGTSTYYTNNPTMTANQIAVYFVTFTSNYGSNNVADNLNGPYGTYTASGQDVTFSLTNGMGGYAYFVSQYPSTVQGVFTSPGAYSGGQITHQLSSLTTSSSYPNIWVNIVCFIYTPPA
jgi:hypothetical protein